MKTLTYTPTDNPSANVHGNQQSIYDINTQRKELDKGMLIANTLKGKPNSQQSTNASWLVTTIKAALKTPIKKFEKPILLFSRTHEAAVRNRKIRAAFKGDLGLEIAAHKDSPFNYGLEFCETMALAKLLLNHEDKTKIINIIRKGSCYHLITIKEEARKSDLDTMMIRENYKSSHSLLKSSGLDKSISKDIDHGWALPLTI